MAITEGGRGSHMSIEKLLEDRHRMRQYATTAKGHPTWSVAYAEDVPKLLDQLADVEGQRNVLYHAVESALSELGVPGDGYPAPVANAVEILRRALVWPR